LFVPQIGVPPPPHERHVPQAVVQRREAPAAANFVVLAILIVIFSGVGVTLWFVYQVTKPTHAFTVSAPAQPAPVVVPQPTVSPNPGTTGPGNGMARANCLMGCLSKCGDPKTDHTAYAACAQGCTKSCE
jgi:hypothetical protein